MQIIFNENSNTFHLFNDKISYIMTVLPNGHLTQVYFGKKIHDREDFSYLIQKSNRPMSAYISEEYHNVISLAHLKQEYPVYGSTDFRHPAVEVCQEMVVKSLISIIKAILLLKVNQNLKIFLLRILKVMMRLSL